MAWWSNWFGRFLIWRIRYVKERNFILFLSLLVGIVSGLAAVLLKNMVHYTHLFFYGTFTGRQREFIVFYLSVYRYMADFSFCKIFCT